MSNRDITKCELCGSTHDIVEYEVNSDQDRKDNTIYICKNCNDRLISLTYVDDAHWQCLAESMWSEIGAVQIISWRILDALSSESWAADLLDQLYLDEDNLAWANSHRFVFEKSGASIKTLDSNGTELTKGDAVTLIKDLDVKGAGFTAKRGTLVKNISLTDDPEHIEGKVNGTQIVLKTCFLKKTN